MKIAIGNDHAGPAYKKAVVKHLEAKGIEHKKSDNKETLLALLNGEE